MKARADYHAAVFFLRTLTGISFSEVRWHTEGLISFTVPYAESHQHVRHTITAALNMYPVETFTAGLGRKRWLWDFGKGRRLILYHFMKDRSRSDARNIIHLEDSGDYTGHYGPTF